MLFNIPMARNLGLVLNATHPYSLHLEGVDRISQIPIESIHIVEAGPGGVSSMQFSIDDSDSSISISDGAEVRMWDYTRDLPMFLGFAERVGYDLWAAVGRTITVSCFGIESLLDTIIIPLMTRSYLDTDSTSAQFRHNDITQAFAALTPLRAFMSPTPGTVSSQALPLANDSAIGLDVGQTFVADGLTIRTAIEGFIALCGDHASVAEGELAPPVLTTVDFYGGIRSWLWLSSLGVAFPGFPSDWDVLTVTNTATGAVATNIKYEKDTSAGAIINAVYVKGATAAGTGWVVGDTRTGRREAYITAVSTDLTSMRSAAGAVLGSKAAGAGRGSFVLEDFTPINAHPGGSLILTDARMGWASQQAVITQIEKTIIPGALYHNWTVSFLLSGDGPSAGPASTTRYLRTLTRATLQ